MATRDQAIEHIWRSLWDGPFEDWNCTGDGTCIREYERMMELSVPSATRGDVREITRHAMFIDAIFEGYGYQYDIICRLTAVRLRLLYARFSPEDPKLISPQLGYYCRSNLPELIRKEWRSRW